MEAITVKQLFVECKKQIEKGNGDKIVLLSDDDEGNGYHTLFYGFTDDPENLALCCEDAHDGQSPEDVVVLG